jgi:hypothetical protein
MDFLDISSMGVAYRYVVKIGKKFKKQSKQGFRFENTPQQNHGKGNPNSQNKGQRKEGQSQEIHSNMQAKKGNRKSKKNTENWCEFHKIP